MWYEMNPTAILCQIKALDQQPLILRGDKGLYDMVRHNKSYKYGE